MGVIFDEVVTEVVEPVPAPRSEESAAQTEAPQASAEVERRRWLREHNDHRRRLQRLEAD